LAFARKQFVLTSGEMNAEEKKYTFTYIYLELIGAYLVFSLMRSVCSLICMKRTFEKPKPT
jgi:hypothetical protein